MMTKCVSQCNQSSLLVIFLFVVVLILPTKLSFGYKLSSKRSLRLSENNGTIVSSGAIFELGLYKGARNKPEINRWYLGIWYKRFPGRALWIANTDNPLLESTGTLKIFNSNLLLLDQSGGHVWKTNLTKRVAPLVAELLDNGNFVLRYSNDTSPDGILWQSFDFPTDTLLPGMKLGWDRRTGLNRALTSWPDQDYPPSKVHFKFAIDIQRNSQAFIWKNGRKLYRTPTGYNTFNIKESTEEVSYSLQNSWNYTLLRLNYNGLLRLMVWIGEWEILWDISVSFDKCDVYNACGRNSICEIVSDGQKNCSCIKGFEPSYQKAWEMGDKSHGCVRQFKLKCIEDGVRELRNMKLPDTQGTVVVDTNVLEECQQRCLKSCNCTAFANTNTPNGGSSCMMWTGDLMDIRSYHSTTHASDQHLYIKLAAGIGNIGYEKTKTRITNTRIIGLTFGGFVLLLFSFFLLFYWKSIKKIASKIPTAFGMYALETVCQERNHDLAMEISEEWKSTVIDFDVIVKATNNFSEANEIGKGGFGIVYKGRLLDGKEIAVKRLMNKSVHGIQGFNNEVTLIALIQHVNLVRLVGFCSNADEKIIVYEYLENDSLDSYIFDTTRSSILNWNTRFDIANGIARGLLYLHQDSRFRIIHLDLKPSNVLLGKDMIPKISDFGMAKTLEGDETEADATTVAGTFGYMSPEYARYKVYSAKSDVFSFGVMLLEIISGKKNSQYSRLNNGDNLLSFIWANWNQGKGLEIVDPVIKNSSSEFRHDQVLRCIQIGLLCVQELAEDRPTMLSVVFMLGSEVVEIAQPKPPVEIGSSSIQVSDCESYTVAQRTMSTIDPR